MIACQHGVAIAGGELGKLGVLLRSSLHLFVRKKCRNLPPGKLFTCLPVYLFTASANIANSVKKFILIDTRADLLRIH